MADSHQSRTIRIAASLPRGPDRDLILDALHRRVGATPKKYDHIDFTPPKKVVENAALGLEYREKASPSNKGGLTSAEAGKEGIGSGVQRAVNLKNGDAVSPKVVGKMVGFFSRHEKNKSIAPEHKSEPWNDKGYVSWLLWGGDEGQTWANKVRMQMDKADKQSKTAAAVSNMSALSSEQMTYLNTMVKTINQTMLADEHFKGLVSKISGFVKDDWQTGKVYKKDGFGRMSLLAGVPHALVHLDFRILRPEGNDPLGRTDLEMLLSKNGETALIKDDKYGMRGTKTAAPVKLGQEVAEVIIRDVKEGIRLYNQKEQARKEQQDQLELARQEQGKKDQALTENAKLKEKEVLAVVSKLKRMIKSIDQKIKVAIGNLPEADRPLFFGAEVLPSQVKTTFFCKVFLGNDPEKNGVVIRWSHVRQRLESVEGQSQVFVSEILDASRKLNILADGMVTRWVMERERIKQKAKDDAELEKARLIREQEWVEEQAREQAEKKLLSSIGRRLKSIYLGRVGGRAQSVEEDSPTAWTIEPTKRQRLDHFVGGNYHPDEDDDPEGWDEDGWNDEYAYPVQDAAIEWLNEEFGPDLFYVEVGDKGHVFVSLNNKGIAYFA